MAENLAFAKPRGMMNTDLKRSFRKSLKFFDADGTATMPVFRFVAAGDQGKYVKPTAGGPICGYLAPQIHDDRDSEYYTAHKVGEESDIFMRAEEPVYVEAGAGWAAAGTIKDFADVSTDATGKAIPSGLSQHVVGFVVDDITVDGVRYIGLLMNTPYARITPAA